MKVCTPLPGESRDLRRILLPVVSIIAALLSALGAPPVVAGPTSADAPFHCYLTWQGDPTTTITVNFHSVDSHATAEVLFDTIPQDGTPSLYPFRAEATSHTIPGLDAVAGARRVIHVAELTGLDPGGVYYFVAGSSEGGYTAQRSVRLPGAALDELRFIDGGDMATDAFVPPLLQAAAAQSPRFAILGGDLEYEDGVLADFALWDTWLSNWETHMVTPEGHSVPMIVAVGNHEVAGGYHAAEDPFGRAPFYFGYFAQDGRGFDPARRTYFRRDFGPGASLLVLDTDHVAPPGGAQAEWIAEQLVQLDRVDLRMAAYHVPMYPSERSFNGVEIAPVREAWRPLFDAGGLDVAFEHHDHMLKRTKPLRANAPDPAGTVYFGDGCLGQAPRGGTQARALEDPAHVAALGLSENYLAAWAPARHFWLVEVVPGAQPSAPRLHATALDAAAAVLDETYIVLEPRSSDSGSAHCVATLLFPGAANGDRLDALRAVRDRRLLSNAPGAAFADAYYRLSPEMTEWFQLHPWMLMASQVTMQFASEHSRPAAKWSAILAILLAITVIRQRSARQRINPGSRVTEIERAYPRPPADHCS